MKLLICLIAILALSNADIATVTAPVFITNSAWVAAHKTCNTACITDFTTAWTAILVDNSANNYANQAAKDVGRDVLAKAFIKYDGSLFASYVALKVPGQANKVDGTVMEAIDPACEYVGSISGDNYNEYFAAYSTCYQASGLDSSITAGAIVTTVATMKFNKKSYDTSTPSVTADVAITIAQCMDLCNAGKFDWKTDDSKISYPEEQVKYDVKIETKTKCEADCVSKNKVEYLSYDISMYDYWAAKLDACFTAYTVSGKISLNGITITDEYLDDEGKKLENTNACLITRGAIAESFNINSNWNTDFWAAARSCTNFCKESTLVGQEDRTNALYDVVSECKDVCIADFETAVSFDSADVETKFDESSTSVLSVLSLAMFVFVIIL